MPLLVSSNWAASGVGLATFIFTEIWLFATTEPAERKKNLARNILTGVVVTAFVYITLFIWSTVQTVYDDHHDATGRWQQVVNEKNNLKIELGKRDNYVRQLEQRSCPVCPTGKGRTPPPTITANPQVIQNLNFKVFTRCTLRDPANMPGDMLISLHTGDSFMEGPKGKIILDYPKDVHYTRGDDGTVTFAQTFTLRPESALSGDPIESLLDYRIMLILWAADGSHFSQCDYGDLVVKANGNEIFKAQLHETKILPNDSTKSLSIGPLKMHALELPKGAQ